MGKGKIVQLGCNESSYEALRKLQSDGYDVVAALGSRDKLAEIKKNVDDSVEVCDEHFRDVVLAVTKPDVCIVENGNYETLLSCTRNGVSTVYVGKGLSDEAVYKLDDLCKKYGCTAAIVGTGNDITKSVESTLASAFGCKVMM